MNIANARHASRRDGMPVIVVTDDEGAEWTVLDADADSEIPAALRRYVSAGGAIEPAPTT